MTSNITQSNARNTWMDCIKIFATFLVMLNHSISHVWTSHPIDTLPWKIVHFFFLFGRISIPLFFMCSGAGMLRKEHSFAQIFRKNIFQLLKIYVAWMLLYGVLECITLFQEHLATPKTCINALAKSVLFGHYHTWFIFTLLSLYLITPFLYQITRSRENMQYFLIFSFIFTIVFPLLKNVSFLSRLTTILDDFNMHFVCGYTLYYVAGYYVCTIPWKKLYSYISIFVLTISFAAAYFYSINVSIAQNAPYQDCFMEFSPFMVPAGIALFCIFKEWGSKITSPLIKPLISYGFALYMMHPLLLKYVQKLSGLSVFLGTFALYFGCVAICFLISKNKILTKILLK